MTQSRTSLNKQTGIFLFLTAGLVLSIFGSAIGTYCWFNNRSRATVKYYGTAIGDSESIDMGLISDNQLEGFASAHLMIEDSTTLPGRYIYWCSDSSLNSETILDYETRLGYASNSISPTSSGSYVSGDDLSLKTSPRHLTNKEFSPASKKEYSYLNVAFKSGGGSGSYNYFVNKAVAKSDADVKDAIRIHFENPNETDNKFIYNPASNNDGHTNVGGVLNLSPYNKDVYDVDNGTDYEHIYGEVTNLSYSGERYTGEKTVDPDDVDCFNSNHVRGTYIPTYTPKTANYFGCNNVLSSKVLTHTNPATGIAELKMTIFIEGWDHSCTDSSVSYDYDLSLSFTFGARG